MTTNLDIYWWLVLGLLLGWMGLWFFDKLFLRDGEVAGLRADREISVANAELSSARERLNRVEQESSLLQTDLTAQNDQADVLRTELAVMRNERNSLQSDLNAELARTRTLQQEIDSSRKLAGDRADEISRLELMIEEIQQERETARGWAQAKENELAAAEQQQHRLIGDKQASDQLLARTGKQVTAMQGQMRAAQARLSGPRRPPQREALRMTGRMRKLSAWQSTLDALAAADQARRQAGEPVSEQKEEDQQ